MLKFIKYQRKKLKYQLNEEHKIEKQLKTIEIT